MEPNENEFVAALRRSLAEGDFIMLVLSNPRQRHPEQPRRESIRPVQIRGEQVFQWEQQFDRRQTHLNLDTRETLQRCQDLLGPVYREAYLYTSEQDVIARQLPQGLRVRRKPPSRKPAADAATHDRQKAYLIPEGIPCPFLIALDVMTPAGRVKPSRQKKFRQINRYLEMVNDIAPYLPASGRLRIVDFGCGLSYLTFAVHYLFTAIHGRAVDLLGIDQNDQIIQRCRTIAQDLDLAGISFQTQRIESRPADGQLDLAISLHACDTATDHALACAVSAGARVILAAPCCQHEIAGQISARSLDVLLRQGILKERLAALATDGLRACALEAAGYRTQILEFIDLEHTPKNLLLRSIRRDNPDAARRSAKEYDELKTFLGLKEIATDQILAVRRPVASSLDAGERPDETPLARPASQ